MPAGKDGLLRKDTRDAAAVLAGRITAYGVRRYGRPERSLRREKERQTGTQLNDWDCLMGRAVLRFGG